MIALTLILFACFAIFSVLMGISLDSISRMEFKGLPVWLARTIKIILFIIVGAAVFIGTASLFIVSIAFAMGGVKK